MSYSRASANKTSVFHAAVFAICHLTRGMNHVEVHLSRQEMGGYCDITKGAKDWSGYYNSYELQERLLSH